MEKFIFKDHTADIEFEAYGFSFEEALSNAAGAMLSVIADVGRVARHEQVKIEEKAETMEELVSYTLGDILAESDAQEMFFSGFVVESFAQADGYYSVAGTAYGEEMTPEKGKLDVKAVTMHAISVGQDGRLWKINVVLDI